MSCIIIVLLVQALSALCTWQYVANKNTRKIAGSNGFRSSDVQWSWIVLVILLTTSVVLLADLLYRQAGAVKLLILTPYKEEESVKQT
jgi:heme/copper-type cytochrome/quinol oxidase subunit 2